MEFVWWCFGLGAALAVMAWLQREKPVAPSPLAPADPLTEAVPRDQRMMVDLLNAMDDAVLVVDERATVLFANKAAHALAPSGKEPLGRPAAEMLWDSPLVALIQHAASQRVAVTRELSIASSAMSGSGKQRFLHVEAAPLPLINGLVPATQVVIRDETARHELDEARRDFVAHASHELRTPLSIINGYAENLLDHAEASPEHARHCLGVMKKHGDRIARIVDDMLTLSKLEAAENAGLDARPFDLVACVREIIERLEPLLRQRQAKVEVVANQGEIELRGDQFYWDQVFFNLLENALKYNPQGGLRVVIDLRRESHETVIRVRDDGVGIPAEDLPHIFERFYRVHRSQGQEKGTGLGLAIVRRSVRAHGGDIQVTSEPGVETCFTIRVPEAVLA